MILKAVLLAALLLSALPTVAPVRTTVRLKPGDPVPATAFIDQSGAPFAFDAWRGKFVVIAFIYTRCRDANECPLISAKFAQLQNKLGGNSRLAEVTIDPAYDRPPVLAAYARTFHFKPDRISVLTGDPNAVLDFAAMLDVTAYTDPKYGFIHNDNAVIIAPNGTIAEYIPGASWTPEEIASIIAHYQNRTVNWVARLNVAIIFVIFAAAGGWLIVRLARATRSR